MSDQSKPGDDKLSDGTAAGTSRRNFLAGPAAVGALATAALTPAQLFAATSGTIASIRIPKEIPATLGESAKAGSFEGKGMTGAEVFAKLCKDEELAALFCCPGNYTVINAIAAAGVPAYGGPHRRRDVRRRRRILARHRRSHGVFRNGRPRLHAHDHEYRRRPPPRARRCWCLPATCRSPATIARRSSRPATSSRSPTGMKKYGKRLIAPNRVHEYGAYAFRNLKSGVPGPVHLDFPGEVARARFTDPSTLTDYYGKDKYRSSRAPCASSKDVEKAVDMIDKAERPMSSPDRACFNGRPGTALKQAAEKNDIAVVTSGPTRGQFPRRSPAIREPVAGRADERRSGDLRRPVLHAEPGRVSLQSRHQGDSRPSGARRSGPQLAARSRDRQRRADLPRGARKQAASRRSATRGSNELAAARADIRETKPRRTTNSASSTASDRTICIPP